MTRSRHQKIVPLLLLPSLSWIFFSSLRKILEERNRRKERKKEWEKEGDGESWFTLDSFCDERVYFFLAWNENEILLLSLFLSREFLSSVSPHHPHLFSCLFLYPLLSFCFLLFFSSIPLLSHDLSPNVVSKKRDKIFLMNFTLSKKKREMRELHSSQVWWTSHHFSIWKFQRKGRWKKERTKSEWRRKSCERMKVILPTQPHFTVKLSSLSILTASSWKCSRLNLLAHFITEWDRSLSLSIPFE